MKEGQTVHTWVIIFGVVLLLVGLFAGTRTATNSLLFPHYPQSGVLNVVNTQDISKEEDCMNYAPSTYYDQNGNPRQPTVDEASQSRQQQDNCMKGVTATRENAKKQDMTLSFSFLLLGIGTLVSRRFLVKK